MKQLSQLELMSTWSPEQLLAVHEFCQLMSDTIWQHHAQQLIEYVREDCCPAEKQPSLPLDFDDELPF